MTTIGQFLGLKDEKPALVEVGTTNKWFVLLSSPEEFDDFRVIIRRALENAEAKGEKLKVTVQRIAE